MDSGANVLIMSASEERTDIATAYQLGANGYLVKPSEASKLEVMVKSIQDFWLAQNTSPAEGDITFGLDAIKIPVFTRLKIS
jgi:DNA-binding NarL/FixJ family response regulator